MHTLQLTQGLIPLDLRRPGRVRYCPPQHRRSLEAARGIAEARARTRPARPVDDTGIRARPRGFAGCERNA